jgi:hypothetical protein
VFDHDVFALDVTEVLQALPERIRKRIETFIVWANASLYKADPWNFASLLRGRGKTKRKQHDAKRQSRHSMFHEFTSASVSRFHCPVFSASYHRITLSALAKTFGGIA